jgi:soluble lytic murein transglycosylase-like protein
MQPQSPALRAALRQLELRKRRRQARRRLQLQRRLTALFLLASLAALLAGFGSAQRAPAETLAPSHVGTPRPHRPLRRLQGVPGVTQPPAALCPIPAHFRAYFSAASQQTGTPLALLTAVAEVESTWDPDAQSSAGAQGLFQLLPATAKSVAAGDGVAGVAANVLGGARYLRLLLDRFDSERLALAAYNAGPTLVDRLNAVPAYPETEAYVAKVTALENTYSAAVAAC